MTTTTASIPAREPFGARRLLLIVSGSLAALLAVALLAVGAVAGVALGERDGTGYLNTDTHSFSGGGHALVTGNLDVSDAPSWFGEHLATVRIEATATEPVFVGIAPTADVERYLAGVAHDRVTDVDTDPFAPEYEAVAGARTPQSPASLGFWRVQASGSGTQTISWPLEDGDWSAVAMNADGSGPVAVDARFGAKIGALGWLVFGFLTAGGLALVGGVALVYFGARSPRP
jgi:hypothetical protein